MTTLRSTLYRLARALNDANAIKRGPRAVGKRAIRKAAWRAAARIIAKTLR